MHELPEDVSKEDVAHLIRDKYQGDTSTDISEDLKRIAAGEPLAYVIGWIPFLGLRIQLNSHPLIPRPETEWWTEELISHCREKFGDTSFTLLDLCAGSGAIGLAVLHALPNATVCFGELVPEHLETIRKNLRENTLDESHATLRAGDLFTPFSSDTFDIIATNPPYIPSTRPLPESVSTYEPADALFSGEDGLTLIRRIAREAPCQLEPGGELWLEADINNIENASEILKHEGASSVTLHTDLYGRPRLLVGYYS